jgi:hypothetical protein
MSRCLIVQGRGLNTVRRQARCLLAYARGFLFSDYSAFTVRFPYSIYIFILFSIISIAYIEVWLVSY